MNRFRATEASVGAGPAAGLGPRVAAFAFDYLPIAAYLAVLVAVGLAVGWAFPDAVARAFAQPGQAQAIGFVLVTLPVGLYFALSEASGFRATWGKRRLGLVVVGPGGARLGLGRSLARTGVKFVPWELAHAAVWGIALVGGEPALVHQVLLALTWLLVGANALGIGVWRRAALVSTVALNVRSHGGRGDTRRTLAVCDLLVDDHDDMVVKAMSWALRELVIHDAAAVRGFVSEHESVLAARVKREVRHKLATGLKNPRPKRG